ncbi:hypothetical protein [Methanolobus profundi]|uniref:Uncharacterized protein n=1 Tax=Methanolobus profundi TaxID=487685 RepID=A0A1I4UNY5_9EURY|nr:hypothetical protein [Methanolobus profundi]SFM90625.1 hypothetical protein SAMN04488696_2814 [Methanolobus profundi]
MPENNHVRSFDTISITTCVAFINICFALIFYLKGGYSPFEEGLTKVFVLFIAIIDVAFLVSAMATYVGMLISTYEEKLTEMVSIKTVSYAIGIVGFTYATLLMLFELV